MARTQTSGKCLLCQQTFKKGSMTRHFPKCLAKHKAAGAKKERFFHVVVQGGPVYWLHLAVPAQATLQSLDSFLRGKWLECCGHLSAFNIGGQTYDVSPDSGGDFWGPPPKSMKVKAEKIFRPDLQFSYEYDFGSTTELTLKVAGVYEGSAGKKIELLAENDAPEIPCDKCGAQAVNVCCECLCEGEGWLCEEHSEDHKCGDEMFLPVVNSPRVGVCGYMG